MIPQSVINLLKLREGWRTVVYRDTNGLPTAGMGHLMSKYDLSKYPVGSPVPNNVLLAWMSVDVRHAWTAAQAQAASLGITDERFVTALTSVCYQEGVRWTHRFPKTWAAMQRHDWVTAIAESKHSLWNQQTPVRVADFDAAMQAEIPSAQPAVSQTQSASS